MSQLIPILVLATLAWLWWGGTRARETATTAAARACKQCGVQFLDDTVALGRIRLQRDSYGHMRLLRQYNFEFTKDGQIRDKGYAVMLGLKLAQMHLNLLVDDPQGIGDQARH